MAAEPDDLAAYVSQAAPLIGLTIDPAHLPGVIENLNRIRAVAAAVLDFPLPETDEPAPRFEP